MLKHQAKPPPPQWGGVFPKVIEMLIIRKQPSRQDTQAERESRAAARAAHKDIQREKMIEDAIKTAYQEYEQ